MLESRAQIGLETIFCLGCVLKWILHPSAKSQSNVFRRQGTHNQLPLGLALWDVAVRKLKLSPGNTFSY